MKRQLKIWNEDFNRYWNRTSLVMRIVIGAVASFLLAYVITSGLNRPLTSNINKLKKKIASIGVQDDSTVIMDELRQKKTTYSRRCSDLQEKLTKNRENSPGLTRAESGKVIIAIRELFDTHGIKLQIEEKLKKAPAAPKKVNSYQKRHIKKTNTERMHTAIPDFMGSNDYKFKVVGSFSNIKRFLRQLNTLPYVYIVDNIKLCASEVLIFTTNRPPQKGVELEFELHVPYLKKSILNI
jgi:hypothetical protein